MPDSRNKGTRNSAAEPTQPSSGPVVLNPMMPFWPVPPPMGGPAMDYWGAPTSVPMHGKVVATPTSAPSSNSRDIVLSDPAIQVCHSAGFVLLVFICSSILPCTSHKVFFPVDIG